ncbi:hypothetical protein WDL1P1_00544 (plasmid) [Variovorax sp. WDL1]|nr:hypothetical protein CHC06_06110 [Variovorax sp. B2]PNG51359.1 hypothetical protein CHC07_06016 [Variovorax sp. B4]VTU43125.1 hypothetical protein H6P1_00364 [Variovorax sp. PBL-H6]VTU43430.1 hypothetical protein SRS16P1_00541 [Variovorax sp. SRS16]VTU43494.1 hypothetical protein E5P1_00537 [Variovorax sp. PBL-E5]VTV17629.1 hypothetical protein WDL1P1_00544 [Variovorax sp. WDL1]
MNHQSQPDIFESSPGNKFAGVEMRVLAWPPLPSRTRRPFAERKAERVAARSGNPQTTDAPALGLANQR